MTKYLDLLYAALWDMPALLLILGVGLWLTFLSGCIQLRLFPRALKQFCRQFSARRTEGTVSPYRALCTALAATVGTGNLVGVSGAICLGGPGAIFWMLVCAFFGMVIKFAEAVLAVRYRVSQDGEFLGGPMYSIAGGLGKRWLPLAWLYSIFGVLACFGIGNSAQVNAIVSGIKSAAGSFSPPPLLIGTMIAGLLWIVFLGGSSSIGAIAEGLVPVAAAAYILMCLLFLACKVRAIPGALLAIWEGAFCPRAVTGGLIGSAFRALQVGCSRGIFTNEAGMGTASIAHAGADVSHPVQQGMMGIIEVFLDTIVICTMTALVILCSGVPIPYGLEAGAELTVNAFSTVYGKLGKVLLATFLVCFAFATILGWSLYGLRCMQFLFGSKATKAFYFLQIAVSFGGALLNAPTIWRISEILNGLMILPNLTALIFLSPEVIRLIKSDLPYMEVQNADFHKRKPL